MKEEKRESRWKGIIMLVLGFIFMLPVLLIVMNSFKTGKEILTNFVSFQHRSIWITLPGQ